ncbi:MAG TPA: hypothetical protein VK590_11550 [Saprospiraceae bacterium]|nr:hypothetical protein [Saprospiraceae bacterium]
MTMNNFYKEYLLSNDVKIEVMTTITTQDNGTETKIKSCKILQSGYYGNAISIKLFELIVLREVASDIITELKTI